MFVVNYITGSAMLAGFTFHNQKKAKKETYKFLLFF